MPAATTIVVARDDFSIPGGENHDGNSSLEPMTLESRFFNLLRESKPDVVVLDLRQANGDGVGMILKIRRQSSVPILVVCGQDNQCAQDYRFAGAAECIASPVDVVAFNEVLQQIVRVNGQQAAVPQSPREAAAIEFSGATFRPHQNLMQGADGKAVHLTTAESLLLAHFVANPWEIQTRSALAEALYGKHRPATDRAIDVVVNRLRTKLRSIGETTEHLIKTEFRRGYRFVCDTSADR
jgi:DNA-binding response OmpR family regulator